MPSIEKLTSFQRIIHGFKFPNSFDTRVLLDIIGDRLPDLLKDFADEFFDNVGLCGGMCWAALDRYFSGKPIEEVNVAPTSSNDPLLIELTNRQLDSFRGFAIIEKCLAWQQKTGDNKGNPLLGALTDEKNEIGRDTQKEWPGIKQKLDAGIPANLCLIYGSWYGKPWKNHQVIATGYLLNSDTNVVRIYVYDPNRPYNPSKTEDYNDPRRYSYIQISLGSGKGDHNLNLSHSVSKYDYRGFFLWPYDRTEIFIPEGQVVIPKGKDDLSYFWTIWS
jgi:hypothetical protein